MSNHLRVAINIEVMPGEAGGVVQSTQGLVRSLGELEGPERYILAAKNGEIADWISAYRGPNQEVRVRTRVNAPAAERGFKASVKAALKPAVRGIRRIMGRLIPEQWPSVPISDGYFESLGCNIIHFPTQSYELCALPSIYNPHDLQHLHYPQFWTAHDLAFREVMYRTACQFSHTIAVGSNWIKEDVVRQYGVHPSKVQIIPWATPITQYPEIEPGELDKVKAKFGLPGTFAFYPAVTWAHKNHIRLLEAMAQLRDRTGLVINLVCSGSLNKSHWPAIQQTIRDLKLEGQTKFLGFISESELRATYQLAQFLVLPSLFEADSCPIHEAWTEGLPVASSDLTGLPDQVGEAGLLFDAKNVDSIAAALQRMATDAPFREELKRRGYRRVNDFDWERTAKAYRAVYRRAAGLTLSEEDRFLLDWDWMRFPRRTADQEISCEATNSYR